MFPRTVDFLKGEPFCRKFRKFWEQIHSKTKIPDETFPKILGIPFTILASFLEILEIGILIGKSVLIEVIGEWK